MITVLNNERQDIITKIKDKITSLKLKKDIIIKQKQQEYFKNEVNKEILEIDKKRKAAIAEIDSKYQADIAALKKVYDENIAEATALYDHKTSALITKGNEFIALTAGSAFDAEIALYQDILNKLLTNTNKEV